MTRRARRPWWRGYEVGLSLIAAALLVTALHALAGALARSSAAASPSTLDAAPALDASSPSDTMPDVPRPGPAVGSVR